MITASIHDAKTNLSKYIAAAKRGEAVYFGSRGKPEVRLLVETPPKVPRTFGVLKKERQNLPDLEAIDQSPEWQAVIDTMNKGPLHHD